MSADWLLSLLTWLFLFVLGHGIQWRFTDTTIFSSPFLFFIKFLSRCQASHYFLLSGICKVLDLYKDPSFSEPNGNSLRVSSSSWTPGTVSSVTLFLHHKPLIRFKVNINSLSSVSIGKSYILLSTISMTTWFSGHVSPLVPTPPPQTFLWRPRLSSPSPLNICFDSVVQYYVSFFSLNGKEYLVPSLCLYWGISFISTISFLRLQRSVYLGLPFTRGSLNYWLEETLDFSLLSNRSGTLSIKFKEKYNKISTYTHFETKE